MRIVQNRRISTDQLLSHFSRDQMARIIIFVAVTHWRFGRALALLFAGSVEIVGATSLFFVGAPVQTHVAVACGQ